MSSYYGQGWGGEGGEGKLKQNDSVTKKGNLDSPGILALKMKTGNSSTDVFCLDGKLLLHSLWITE